MSLIRDTDDKSPTGRPKRLRLCRRHPPHHPQRHARRRAAQDINGRSAAAGGENRQWHQGAGGAQAPDNLHSTGREARRTEMGREKRRVLHYPEPRATQAHLRRPTAGHHHTRARAGNQQESLDTPATLHRRAKTQGGQLQARTTAATTATTASVSHIHLCHFPRIPRSITRTHNAGVMLHCSVDAPT